MGKNIYPGRFGACGQNANLISKFERVFHICAVRVDHDRVGDAIYHLQAYFLGQFLGVH